MRVHLFHGFNVWDGGKGTTDRLAPFLKAKGHIVIEQDYGWVGLLGLRFRNRSVVEKAAEQIRSGDVIIAHSNGCLIAWELANMGLPIRAVICIQPALRRDSLWPMTAKVLCLHNDGDIPVRLSRIWGRFVSVANPFRDRHGWGAAGSHGFTSRQPNVENWNTGKGIAPVRGHSTIFQHEALEYWGPQICSWLQ